MGSSHLAMGTTAGAALASGLAYVGVPAHMAIVAGGVAAAGSLAPDLDHVNGRAVVGKRAAHDAKYVSTLVRSFGGHRTWTHDLRLGPPVFAAVTLVLAALGGGDFLSYSWAIALGMWVGCATHLWGDARTISGIPFGDRKINIGRPIRTGSDAETRRRMLIYRPLAVASCIGALWLILKAM